MDSETQPIAAGYYLLLKQWKDPTEFLTATDLGRVAYMHLHTMAGHGLLKTNQLMSYRPTAAGLEAIKIYEEYWSF